MVYFVKVRYGPEDIIVPSSSNDEPGDSLTLWCLVTLESLISPFFLSNHNHEHIQEP
jgi:hypothetical protein